KGITLRNLQRYEEALQALDRALELDPEDVYAWYTRGLTLLNLQKYEEALQVFDRVLELDPEDVYTWVGKGAALGNLQKYEEALQAFDRALELDPEDVYTWFNKGSVHLKISEQEFKMNNFGNAIKNLDYTMNFFSKIWDKKEEEIKEEIMNFFKDLIDSKKTEALDTSLKIILKKKEELTEFLEPISVGLEIVKTRNIKKFYDLQVEKRDVVVDIVRKLTGSEELILDEYRRSRRKRF
ncbi:MAG: tetratricopeptide repeat protein, partial [Candidatus Methanofastidiosia archaeon]